MTDADLPAAALYVDRCIEAYASRCRDRIPAFVERHFSLEQTWAIQRQTVWFDLLLAPLNSAWAVPFLAAKKTCGMLEAVGLTSAPRVLAYLPPGIKTGYQRTIETLIRVELLEWDRDDDRRGVPHGLVRDLQQHALLERLPPLHDATAGPSLRPVIENFSAGRTLVSSVAGSLLTIACGWFVAGNTSLGLGEIATRLARRNAHDRAVSHFVLGRRAGSVFYRVFPPAASRTETMITLLVLGAAITVGALACTVASDPLRKIAGLHQRRLSALVDDIERELMVFSQKRIKHALTASSA